MFCIKCGEKYEKGEKFCTNCGNDLVLQAELSKHKGQSNVNPTVVSTPSSSNNGLLSLIFGIVTILSPILFPLAIVGLILGLTEKEQDAKKTVGIILNSIAIVIFIFLLFLFMIFLIGIADSCECEYSDPYPYPYDYYDYYDIEDEYSNQVVGNDIYGYLTIPNSWYKLVSTKKDAIPQYSYANVYYVSLDIMDDDISLEKAVERLENNLADDASVSHEKEKFNQYDAYKISGIYKNGNYIHIYVFKAEDKKIHLITMEGPDDEHSFFEIPYSYTFNSFRRSYDESF